MKVKFLKKCKYSEDGLHVKSVEKDQEVELINELRGKELCKSKFCIEVKEESSNSEESKGETKKQRKAREKADKKVAEEDDFLS